MYFQSDDPSLLLFVIDRMYSHLVDKLNPVKKALLLTSTQEFFLHYLTPMMFERSIYNAGVNWYLLFFAHIFPRYLIKCVVIQVFGDVIHMVFRKKLTRYFLKADICSYPSYCFGILYFGVSNFLWRRYKFLLRKSKHFDNKKACESKANSLLACTVWCIMGYIVSKFEQVGGPKWTS